MVKRNFLLLIIGLIPLLSFGQELDSIAQREIRTGIHMNLESVSDKLLSGNDGYSFEIGAYQERKLLNKVLLSYEGGVRYKSYNEEVILVDTTPTVSDTVSIVNLFNVQHDNLKFTSAISFRFIYADNPRIYFVLGIGPEITFRRRVEPIYISTFYADKDFVRIGESDDTPPDVTDNSFRVKGINLRIDIGIGIELKKFNIEIVNRSDENQNIGLRLRYRFNTLTY